MYRLVLQLNQQSQKIFDLSEDEVVIGRDIAAQIFIPDPSISRRHARVFLSGGQYFVEDLNSSNGTHLNGQPVHAPQALRPGDEIQLGPSIALQFDGPPPPVAQAAATVNLGDEPPGMFSLFVQVGEKSPQIIPLPPGQYKFGRSTDNHIIIESLAISRYHGRLDVSQQGVTLVPSPRAGNPVVLNDQALTQAAEIPVGRPFYVNGPDPTMRVTLRLIGPGLAAPAEARQQTSATQYAPIPAGTPTPQPMPVTPPTPRPPAPETPAAGPRTRRVDFGDASLVRIGRDTSNDIVLDHPTVSRFHAQIEHIGERYRLRDLNSANGTFVADRPVQGEVWINPQDHVRIGPFRFVVGAEGLAQIDETGGMRIDAVGLNKWVRKDLNLLQDISISIHPREFVVVVGQSGGGKSTLVDALAGYRPAGNGKVYVNGIDIYENFEVVRSEIGYVPQRDIIHMELSVYQALDYSARLRMPRDTSKQERHKRIEEVLQDLDLTHRKNVQISRLSGGQQKRVSIGVELLTRPGLFFLDEPTSGLDPGGESALMQLMRRLADQGRTIILVTHATKNVMLADKVVFLARGGFLAWFGPPAEALAYFDQYRSPEERRSGPMEFDKIYAILDDPQRGGPQDWAERYQNHPAYRKYIIEPLGQQGRLDGVLSQSAVQRMGVGNVVSRAPARIPQRRSASSLAQFLILTSRNINILRRDHFSLVLMIVIAPVIALMSFILSSSTGSNPWDYTYGNFPGIILAIFTLPIFSVMVGGLALMREFVKETDIYRRERLVNLRILPYVLSKIVVAMAFAVYQALAYVIIHYLAFTVPGGIEEAILIYITTFLAAMAGMMMGLLASAIAPNNNSAPLIMIIFLIPQFILAGAFVKLPTTVTAPVSARWAYEALMSITGAGSDVIRDPCWAMEKTARDNLTQAQKEQFGCNCSGLQALRQESCNFPGLGQFYVDAIDQPAPVAPKAVGPAPAEPVFPAPPPEPTNPNDPLSGAQYIQALKAYNVEVERIRSIYKQAIDAYQQEVDRYRERAIAYEKEKATWDIARNAAVAKAEGLINPFYRDQSWAFADKSDVKAYFGKLLTDWLAQCIILLVAFLAIILLFKRKDYVS